MAEHLTEEEQVEAIKRWWSENWLSLVAPIVIAIVAYTGWNYWTGYKVEQTQLASDSYQQLLELVDKADASDSSGDDKAMAKTAAQALSDDASGMYGDLSSLILARFEVQADELTEAESTLRGVMDTGSTEAVQHIARARLAKVLVAQARYDDALATLTSNGDDATRSLYAEIRGDAYLAKGEKEAAHTAYQQAIDALLSSQANHRGILQFKLDSTATVVSEELAVADDQPNTDLAQ